MRTWHCVNCDSLLVEAPTTKGHMDCGLHGKICFDCIDRMAFYMAKHRALENVESPKPAHNTARDAILAIVEAWDSCNHIALSKTIEVARGFLPKRHP